MYLTYDLWCEVHELYERVLDHYGRPIGNDEDPMLVIYCDPDDCYGWYAYDEIGINVGKCETWSDVVETVIHEVWHHIQGPDRDDEEAYEREANEVSSRDLHLFISPLAA